MKLIKAVPNTLRQLFSNSFIIPNYQRPYSWELDQCGQLWEDIVNFHETTVSGGSADIYFIGNIVIHPGDDGKFAVIDGQQRLVTLSLLFKALYSRAGTADILNECLLQRDKLTSKLTDELRIRSEAVESDTETYRKIILGQELSKDDNQTNLSKNFNFLQENIDKWRNQNALDSGKFNDLILALLDNTVLLKIESDNQEDALTMFETINDRGMPLSEIDLFKEKLLVSVPQADQLKFVKDWNGLKDHLWLFRALMHVLRGKEGDCGHEKRNLRAFFTDLKKSYFKDWESIISSLKKINSIDQHWYQDRDDGWGNADALRAVLREYRHNLWRYPLYVFLHENGSYDDENGFSLDEQHREPLEKLLATMVKFYYTKTLVHNYIGYLTEPTYRACVEIANGGDYLAVFEDAINDDERAELSRILNEDRFGRCGKGLVLLSAYLNPGQDKETLGRLCLGYYQFEHILPKQWNNYDGWTDEDHNRYLDTLGNLIPLERKLNITAKNEFFHKKKDVYRSSVVQDALDLLEVDDSGWVPGKVQEVHDSKIRRLEGFFGCR